MTRHRISEKQLAVGCNRDRQTSSDATLTVSGSTEIDRWFDGIHAAPKSEAGWPPLALFQAMLLATWHDLSDVKLADALADRASLRQFCGFSATEPIPERTAFVRFRGELVQRGLDRALFDAIAEQLKTKASPSVRAHWWMQH
jgi:transposase, IS5 family